MHFHTPHIAQNNLPPCHGSTPHTPPGKRPPKGAHLHARRCVYRVDIDFRNAFNAMSQAALWHVMNIFHIPDVDLLQQIYDSATVRLAPNDAESATITFDTGVAQGSITSPQLLNIFINTLTATGQNQGINHGVQIGKDQDDLLAPCTTLKASKTRRPRKHSQKHQLKKCHISHPQSRPTYIPTIFCRRGNF